MIAEKAEVENLEVCPICDVEDNLIHHYSPINKQICDQCYLKLHQKPLPLDEYDLQPDELTKEQFADKAGVSLRNIEIWKKAGKIPAQKLRRRVNDVVRSQLIFKSEDVEKFLSGANEAVNLPKVEKENKSLEKTNTGEQSDFLNASQMFVAESLGKFADSMNNFTENMTKQLPVAVTDAKPFLNIKEAAEFSEISESCLRGLVKDAVLTKFTGKHGEVLISRKQLLNL